MHFAANLQLFGIEKNPVFFEKKKRILVEFFFKNGRILVESCVLNLAFFSCKNFLGQNHAILKKAFFWPPDVENTHADNLLLPVEKNENFTTDFWFSIFESINIPTGYKIRLWNAYNFSKCQLRKIHKASTKIHKSVVKLEIKIML